MMEYETRGFPELNKLKVPISKSNELPIFNNTNNYDSDDLPEFEGVNLIPTNKFNNSDFDDLNVPVPPPELRGKQSLKKFQAIEDEYLEIESEDEDIELVKKELHDGYSKPIFINLDYYTDILKAVTSTNTNIKNFSNIFSKLDNMHKTQDIQIINLNKNFENIQRKLITIDNRLAQEEDN